MPINNRLIGQFGEKIAAGFIISMGNTIVCQNYRCSFGEIDIISRSKKEYIFTEVKTRKNTDYGYPFESVSESKIKKIKKASRHFMTCKGLSQNHGYNLRFDVISILISYELAAAVLSQSTTNTIEINSLIMGTDYELEQITDI